MDGGGSSAGSARAIGSGGGLGGGRRGPLRSMSALVEIRDVSKAFGGVQAVSRVSLDVQEGEILSIIGPNGAGKTTLLNCISSVFHPERGTIRLDGQSSPGSRPPASPPWAWPAPFRTLRSSGA